jgi:hypothetical protein
VVAEDLMLELELNSEVEKERVPQNTEQVELGIADYVVDKLAPGVLMGRI